MSYQWNWSVFSQETVVGDGSTYAGWMLAGLKMTVTVSLSAWGLALLVGMVLGVMRTVPHKGLRTVATTCVEVLRNIPLLVQLFIWYFIVPELLGGGKTVMVGNLIRDQFLKARDWPFGSVLALSLVVMLVVLFAIQARVSRRVSGAS